MERLTACPDTARFSELLGGKLATDEVAAIADHVESCPKCIDTVAKLGDDTLSSALRDAANTVADPEADRVERIIVECTRVALSASRNASTNTVQQGIPAAEPVEHELGFLSPPQEPGEIGRLNGYRVLRMLGQGGMGMVLEAIDVRLKRRVALKIMKPEVAVKESHRVRFLREAQAAAAVEHDNIVPIFQVGEENGVPFIAMPFLKGEPLDARLKAGPLSIPEIISIARQTALGLAEAHANGLIHRDIKPANLWLEANPGRQTESRVKILDFGLARLTSTEGEGNLTQSGAILGTPAYMAPEQGRGEAVDPRADLFSLGCVLYEMATGQRPFRGSNTMAILTSLAIDEPAAANSINPQLPPALTQLIGQLLQKNPAKRPASAAAVAETLRKMQPDTTVVVMAAQPRPIVETANPWAGIDDDEDASTEIPAAPPPATWRSPEPAEKQAATNRKPFLIALSLLLLAGAAFGAYQLFFKTKDGTLIVEVAEDADVRFKSGELHVFDAKGELKYRLKPSDKNAAVAPGDYKVQVIGADGLKLETAEFTMENNGRAVVKVTVDRVAVAKKEPKFDPRDPDRRAAEWVLGIGGRIFIVEGWQQRQVLAGGELPKNKFDLHTVYLPFVSKVDAGGLVNLQNCTNLVQLDLNGTAVTDAALANLKGCSKLVSLALITTDISDSGLDHLQKSVSLQLVQLQKTKVTKAGVEKLAAALPKCRIEWDGGVLEPKSSPAPAPVTAEQRQALEWLLTNGAQFDVAVGDKIEAVKPKGLLPAAPFVVHSFYTSGLQDFGEATIERLKAIPSIRQNLYFYLTGPKLTDTIFGRLTKIPALRTATDLSFMGTSLTDKGLEHLADFTLLNLDLRGCQGITDAGLELAAKHAKLMSVKLNQTKVTAAGIKKLSAALPKCYIEWDGGVLEPKGSPVVPSPLTVEQRKALEWVQSVGGYFDLDGKEVKPEDLQKLQQLPKVKIYYLRQAAVTDLSIEKFREAPPAWYGLALAKSGLTDAGVIKLCRFPSTASLHWLELNKIPITDKAIEGLQELTHVKILGIRNTKISAAGVKKLATALPDCKIEWDGGVIEPKGSPVPAAITAEQRKSLDWVLASGGRLVVVSNNAARDIAPGGKIPDGPLAVDAVNLKGLKSIDAAALENLRAAPPIWGQLSLGGTNVSDKELEIVAAMTGLRAVFLERTKVTEAGINKLAAACPNLVIDWDDGVIEPNSPPAKPTLAEAQRKPLEWVLATGGRLVVEIRRDTRSLEPNQPLPKTTREVVTVNFKGLKTIDDAALANLRGIPPIGILFLTETSVSDKGLEEIGKLRVGEVFLTKTKVTEAGVKKLAASLPTCKITWDGGVIEPKMK